MGYELCAELGRKLRNDTREHRICVLIYLFKKHSGSEGRVGWRGSCECGKASLEALTILARGDRSRQDGER